jgi:hypothetical protein
VNGILGFSESGTESGSIDPAVEGTITQNGLYALSITCNTTIVSSGEALTLLEFTGLDVAETYTVTMYVRAGAGDSFNATVGLVDTDGWDASDTDFIAGMSETYTQYTFIASPSATTAYLRVSPTSAFSTGEVIYVDNVTITQN